MESLHLTALPVNLTWLREPTAWKETNEALTIETGTETDAFFSPDGGLRVDNVPVALFPADAAFTLSARVNVAFAATFDAGTLQVRVSDDVWAKLCFEYSPQGQPMVVSVVTRGVSDDCNSAVIAGESVYLRITHQGAMFAFHYSLDGKFWHLVRHFSLGDVGDAPLRIGFSAQSPTGQGCAAMFTDIHYASTAVSDLRSGE